MKAQIEIFPKPLPKPVPAIEIENEIEVQEIEILKVDDIKGVPETINVPVDACINANAAIVLVVSSIFPSPIIPKTLALISCSGALNTNCKAKVS